MSIRHMTPNRTALALLLAGVISGYSLQATAAPVVVTPGSMAGYTYFAPAASTGGGGGSGTGEDVSTLQRCLWAPSSGDQTVSVANQFNYTKPITLYYRLVGGNGGSGPSGGGGGSSAILLNGTVAALGKGSDGNAGNAPEVAGTLTIKAGDTLRFVTGGGGGDGMAMPGFTIGGGGGAGYTGGGGGGSINRALTGADYATLPGKGGAATGGAGGTATGGMAGSNGSSLQGGVGTWPNGSAAPTGTQSPNPSNYNAYFMYFDFMGLTVGVNGSKWPATANFRGAPIGDPTNGNQFGWAGGGGKLGYGGGVAMYTQNYWCQGSRATFNWQDDADLKDDASGCPTNYNTYRYLHAQMSKYPAHGSDMKLTRTYPLPTNTGYNPIESTGGSLPGQIITMYQAPVCGFLP